VDLVDEENVAVFQIGQQCGEIAGLGDDRTGGGAEIDAELLRHDLGERRLAEARRPDEKHVIERLAARFRRLDEDLEIGARRRLADEIVQRLRAQGHVDILAALFGRDQAGVGAHARSSMEASRLAALLSNVTVVMQPSSALARAMIASTKSTFSSSARDKASATTSSRSMTMSRRSIIAPTSDKTRFQP
jgi:hypothetical protein